MIKNWKQISFAILPFLLKHSGTPGRKETTALCDKLGLIFPAEITFSLDSQRELFRYIYRLDRGFYCPWPGHFALFLPHFIAQFSLGDLAVGRSTDKNDQKRHDSAMSRRRKGAEAMNIKKSIFVDGEDDESYISGPVMSLWFYWRWFSINTYLSLYCT